MTGATAGDDFLSGASGEVSGPRATTRAFAADAACSAVALATLVGPRLRAAARSLPEQRVLALAVERPDLPNVLARARSELTASRHQVRFVSTAAGDRGRFENLNALLRDNPPADRDWLLLVDDDVVLPRGFLDVFLFVAARFDLAMAQPAHRRRSHAAWEVTRRRCGSIARETSFVEIGPVCALRADTFATLLPFPPLRAGWGLDAHWAAVAREHGWRQGIIDATPIRHGLRPIASTYDRAAAIAEARAFLDGRVHVTAAQAQRTLVTHRSW